MQKLFSLLALLSFIVSCSSGPDLSLLDKKFNESTFAKDVLEFREKKALSDEDALQITSYISFATFAKVQSGKDLLAGKTYRELLQAAKKANLPIPSRK